MVSCTSSNNLFSVNQKKDNMMSWFPIYQTSASKANLPHIEEVSITFNKVFTPKLPYYKLSSPWRTLTFLSLFHIHILRARRFPTMEELACVSTTASTSASP